MSKYAKEPGFHINVLLIVKNGNLEEFKRLQTADFLRGEKGLLSWRVYADPTNEHRFLWAQTWESEAAQKATLETSGHSKTVSLIEPPLVLTPVEIEPGQ